MKDRNKYQQNKGKDKTKNLIVLQNITAFRNLLGPRVKNLVSWLRINETENKWALTLFDW